MRAGPDERHHPGGGWVTIHGRWITRTSPFVVCGGECRLPGDHRVGLTVLSKPNTHRMRATTEGCRHLNPADAEAPGRLPDPYPKAIRFGVGPGAKSELGRLSERDACEIPLR
jgi:hypothetical protein